MAEKTIHIPYGKGEATLTLPQERIPLPCAKW